MSCGTPLVAIVLAPVALLLLILSWDMALVPLYRFVRFSQIAIEWRLDNEIPAKRISAIRDIGLLSSVDDVWLDKLIVRMGDDESADVRVAAAKVVGQHGQTRTLSEKAVEELSTLVLTAEGDAMLSASISAVGQSALNSRYSKQLIERIASVLGEQHAPWLYPRAITALGQIGASQPLPDAVFTIANTLFTDPVRQGERENLAQAFSEIAKGRGLPVTTLDIIAAALPAEPNYRTRGALIYALAYAAADYPPATAVLKKALSSPDPNTVQAAEHGLRILETNEMLGSKDLLTLALDVSEPAKARLTALQTLRSSHIDRAVYREIVSLAADQDSDIAVAAIGLFRRFARSPIDDFDSTILISALKHAMVDADPEIRHAAYSVLSTIARRLPNHLGDADLLIDLEPA
jgi:HEAT repeat protein